MNDGRRPETSTGDARRMELVVMRAETDALIAAWRKRGVDYDRIAARFHQASLDMAHEKHEEAKARAKALAEGNGNGKMSQRASLLGLLP